MVFRIGGDEFAVICEGRDYENIDLLMEEMDALNMQPKTKDSVQIACGMAQLNDEERVEAVFERADRQMYKHKISLKA